MEVQQGRCGLGSTEGVHGGGARQGADGGLQRGFSMTVRAEKIR